MKYLLDTNTCIVLLNGRHPELAKKLSSVFAKDVGISSIVWFELRFGAAKSTKRVEVDKRLQTFALQMEIAPFDAPASEAAAAIRAQLEKAGKPIGSFDTLIAGHAVALGATLVTHNLLEFKRVRGLRTTDWVTAPAAGVTTTSKR